MTLVDTSVWIDHLRRADHVLQDLLLSQDVATHPYVIGELSLGNLRNRSEILGLLKKLPQLAVADHDEVLSLVERRHLSGSGLGWVDVHLLASCLLADCRLLTRDRTLLNASRKIGLEHR